MRRTVTAEVKQIKSARELVNLKQSRLRENFWSAGSHNKGVRTGAENWREGFKCD
jgi:hypothetical protein